MPHKFCPDCEHEYLVELTNRCNSCGTPICQLCKSSRGDGRGMSGICSTCREILYYEKVVKKRKG